MRQTVSAPSHQTDREARATLSGAYAWYTLGVMFLVYAVNFIDRQLLAILAPDIAKDLHLTLADLGFLYGTAFAVFYSLFGLTLGKLADMWNRTWLMAIGLVLWSVMTSLSGFATSLLTLTLARIGVGIGEASANPCAYSILGDRFPKEKRASVLSIYSSGLYLGGGLSLFIGGAIVQWWNHRFLGGSAPLGLAGWQAAFIIVGAPGLLLALLVVTLKEPIRGSVDGIPTPPEQNIWPKFLNELASVLPPLTLYNLIRHKAGTRQIGLNVLLATLVTIVAAFLIRVLGDWKQWVALGVGTYAIASWVQSLAVKDRPAFTLTWGTRPFVALLLCAGGITSTTYALGYYFVQYAMPMFDLNKNQAGLYLGVPGAFCAALGATTGGFGADWASRRHEAGRLIWVIATYGIGLPVTLFCLNTHSLGSFLISFCIVNFMGPLWLGGIAATMQEMVLPRMRGIAAASLFVGTTMIGLGVGPYACGFLADLSIGSARPLIGSDPMILANGLRDGMLGMLWIAPIVVTLLIVALRTQPKATRTSIERARAAGEPV